MEDKSKSTMWTKLLIPFAPVIAEQVKKYGVSFLILMAAICYIHLDKIATHKLFLKCTEEQRQLLQDVVNNNTAAMIDLKNKD